MISKDYHIYSTEYGDGMYRSNVEDLSCPLTLNCTGSSSLPFMISTNAPTGRHDFYLLYIVGGTLYMSFPDGEKKLTAGHFIVIPPNTPYKYHCREEDMLTYLWVHFTGYDARRRYEQYGIEAYPGINKITADGKIVARFNSMFESFANNDGFRKAELALLLERLFLSLGRRLSAENAIKSMKASLGYIHANYNTPIKIPELAKLENLSVSRYNTVFRESIGTSPTEYICSVRMSAACELLSSTDLSVMEISANVGYSDAHFFSKMFKKKVGLAPIDYRKNELASMERRVDDI